MFCSIILLVLFLIMMIIAINLDEQRRIIRRSARRYLETKVVVAPDSHKFHGSDTTRFVTTVMNMVCLVLIFLARRNKKNPQCLFSIILAYTFTYLSAI